MTVECTAAALDEAGRPCVILSEAKNLARSSTELSHSNRWPSLGAKRFLAALGMTGMQPWEET